MASTLSMDVWRRFARLVEDGLSGRAAAARLMLSPARRGRPPGAGKLGPNREALCAMVKADADIAMPELAAALKDATGFRVAPPR